MTSTYQYEKFSINSYKFHLIFSTFFDQQIVVDVGWQKNHRNMDARREVITCFEEVIHLQRWIIEWNTSTLKSLRCNASRGIN